MTEYLSTYLRALPTVNQQGSTSFQTVSCTFRFHHGATANMPANSTFVMQIKRGRTGARLHHPLTLPFTLIPLDTSMVSVFSRYYGTWVLGSFGSFLKSFCNALIT